MDYVLSDCGAEKSHAIGKPLRHTSAMQGKVGNAGALHKEIVMVLERLGEGSVQENKSPTSRKGREKLIG
jgi:hypothetical protein